jgi:hypothetical protein
MTAEHRVAWPGHAPTEIPENYVFAGTVSAEAQPPRRAA